MSDLETRIREALDGRYAIERELGSGGMAVVYLARDLRHDREVALKVLRPEIAVSSGPARFAGEIRSVAQLSHPNILPLYDSGQADGMVYYVMPFVEGESLQERLAREGPLDEPEAVRIASEVAKGLAYAHDRGVVHRDIKPGNIMLSEAGHAMIADFGIAKAADHADGQGLTQTGAMVGTPVYMSPEQFDGSSELDGRSDLYSLSCVTFEMLTGRSPFQGASVFALMASHSTGEIPAVRDFRSEISKETESVILKGLAKRPDDRFTTTGEFATAIVTGERVVPVRPAGSGRIRRLARPGVLAGIVASLLAGVALALAFQGRGQPGTTEPALVAAPSVEANRVVVAPLENMQGDAALEGLGDMGADWITQGLHESGVIDVIPSPTARQASRFVAAGLADGTIADPVQAISEETDAGVVVSGRYYTLGDSLYFQLDITNVVTGEVLDALGPIGGTPSEPLAVVQELRNQVMASLALNLDERLGAIGPGAPLPSFEAYRAFSRGMDAYIDSDWEAALAEFYQAFELDADFPIPMMYASLVHSTRAEFVAADSALTRIVEARDQLSDYHRYWVEHLEAMYRGERDRAFESIRRASDLSPGSKASYNAGWAAIFTRRPEEALELLDRLDPDRGPMRGWVHWWRARADALHILGRYAEGLELATELRRRYPDFVDPYGIQAGFLIGLGRVDEAMPLVDEALAHEGRVYTPGRVALGIANELQWHGYDAEGIDALGRALAWYEALPADRLAQPSISANYATALFRLGRLEEAEAVWADLSRRFPDRWSYRLAPGLSAAAGGDVARADAIAAELAAVDDVFARGENTRLRAAIASYLGRDDEAIALMRQSHDEGLFWPVHPEQGFLRLRGNPDFDAIASFSRDN